MIRNARWRRSLLVFPLFFAMIIATQSAWCQASPQQSKPDNSRKKWQLKFSVGADFIPRQFEGIKIYLQRRIAENGAMRFGAGLRRLDRNLMSKNNIIDSRRDYSQEIDRDEDHSVLQLDLTYIDYIKSTTAIRPYIGIGAFYDHTIFGYDQDNQSFGIRPSESSRIYENRFVDTGLRTVMGVEWRLNSVLILQVEYNLMFHYIRYRTDSFYDILSSTPEYVGESTVYRDYYRINAGNIHTGVSIAF